MTAPSRVSSIDQDSYAAWGDARLVRACLGGDQEAWGALVSRYQRLIYSIPIRYGAQPDDAADIFQAVCLELFRELPRLRKTQSISSWLVTVTAHQAFQWKRRQQSRFTREQEPHETDDVAAPDGVPSEILEAAEREQILLDAIRALPPRCAELVRLLFFESPPVPYAEAARRLGLAPGSIGFIRGRCLKKLQRALQERGFEP